MTVMFCCPPNTLRHASTATFWMNVIVLGLSLVEMLYFEYTNHAALSISCAAAGLGLIMGIGLRGCGLDSHGVATRFVLTFVIMLSTVTAFVYAATVPWEIYVLGTAGFAIPGGAIALEILRCVSILFTVLILFGLIRMACKESEPRNEEASLPRRPTWIMRHMSAKSNQTPFQPSTAGAGADAI